VKYDDERDGVERELAGEDESVVVGIKSCLWRELRGLGVD
jgi:hypothetical protein